MQALDGTWLGVVLLVLPFVPPLLIAIAASTFAIRVRSGLAVLLAVGAAGSFAVTLAQDAYFLYVAPRYSPSAGSAFSLGNMGFSGIGFAFRLTFAIALGLLLRQVWTAWTARSAGDVPPVHLETSGSTPA